MTETAESASEQPPESVRVAVKWRDYALEWESASKRAVADLEAGLPARERLLAVQQSAVDSWAVCVSHSLRFLLGAG